MQKIIKTMQTNDVKNKYNQDIAGKFNNEYEKERWFKNGIQKAGYEMTLGAIKKFALQKEFASCFELGPGHGTWTKELLEFQPHAEYLLLDISSAMLALAQARFQDKNNIEYLENDFLQFESAHQYEFFFSSRALEYIPDKEKAVKKIADLIVPGGRGFVITKTPKYLRNQILGRIISEFHSGQIAPAALKKLLANNNCVEIKIYPVTMSWPFWRSARMNLLLCKLFSNRALNFVSRFFSESYCVVFRKK